MASIDLEISKESKLFFIANKQLKKENYVDFLKKILSHYKSIEIENIIKIIQKNELYKIEKKNILTLTVDPENINDEYSYFQNLFISLKKKFPKLRYKTFLLILIDHYINEINTNS